MVLLKEFSVKTRVRAYGLASTLARDIVADAHCPEQDCGENRAIRESPNGGDMNGG
jgi:hypothetical protein